MWNLHIIFTVLSKGRFVESAQNFYSLIGRTFCGICTEFLQPYRIFTALSEGCFVESAQNFYSLIGRTFCGICTEFLQPYRKDVLWNLHRIFTALSNFYSLIGRTFCRICQNFYSGETSRLAQNEPACNSRPSIVVTTLHRVSLSRARALALHHRLSLFTLA